MQKSRKGGEKEKKNSVHFQLQEEREYGSAFLPLEVEDLGDDILH